MLNELLSKLDLEPDLVASLNTTGNEFGDSLLEYEKLSENELEYILFKQMFRQVFIFS